MSKKKRKSSFFKKVAYSMLAIMFVSGGLKIYELYCFVYVSNVNTGDSDKKYIYIPTGSTLNDVANILYKQNLVINRNAFEWVAEQKKYKRRIHPGRYELVDGMNNNELVDLLRSGNQAPIHLTIQNILTVELLSGWIGRNLEADSSGIHHLLTDVDFLAAYQLKLDEALCLIIPNTYQFNWNTSDSAFVRRMHREYNRFWNASRLAKANTLQLSPVQVSILASIVQLETRKDEELPIVAGVYLNRLRKGMRLQADPTLLRAAGDYSLRRILNKHKKIDSPYNTYKYKGLPPGPICLPDIRTIDAVLNVQAHDYLFFCAKEDFSGYHNFASTYAQHRRNAKRYQRELDRRKIK